MQKLIITAALTGGIHGKEANPALPEQPDEIINAAHECYNAGAAIVHIHARDKDGKQIASKEIFLRLMKEYGAAAHSLFKILPEFQAFP